MSSLIDNLNSIYTTKLQIKNVIGTQSDVFSEYPALIEAALEGGGVTWEEVEQAGYVVPVGTITLTENGTADVSSFAYANVAVSGSASGTYNITDNGNYDISTYQFVYVNVSGGGGSTYSLVSGYVFDTMGTTLGYMNDNTSYLSYAFTLDSMTPSVSFGEALAVSGNYDAFTSVGLGLGSVEGNGTYTMSGYTPLTDSSGWSEFNISNVLTEQPSVSIDFNLKLYKDQNLYGCPFDIDYTVSGYVPLVISSMSYSLDGGMVYNSMNYDSLNNSYSSDFGGMNIMAPSSQNVIVKAEYNNGGTVKYLSASIGMADYGSPAVAFGSWQADTMTGQVFLDNMMGSTDKTITSFTVNDNANVTVEYTDSGQPVVTDKLRVECMTAGATNTIDLDDDATNPWTGTIDAGTVSFVDIATGNNLFPETSQTISTQGVMTEFDVVVTANPGTVTVLDTGLYSVYAYKNPMTGNWTVNFTPETAPTVNSITITYTVDGVPITETFTHGQTVMMTFDTDTLAFTDQDGNSLNADGATDYYINMNGSQSFYVFSTASPVNVYVSEAGTYDVYAAFDDMTLQWNLSFTPNTPA